MTIPNIDTTADYEAEAKRLYCERMRSARDEHDEADIAARMLYETEDADD